MRFFFAFIACASLVACERELEALENPVAAGAAIGAAATLVAGGSVLEGAIIGGAVGVLIDQSQ